MVTERLENLESYQYDKKRKWARESQSEDILGICGPTK
jgi:hypothetical protein